MKDWQLNLLQNFLIGGLVTISVSYIGTFFSPIVAAIWWAFPVSLLPTLYYMHLEGKSNKYLAFFSYTTTFALIVLFFTTMAMSHFYNQEKKSFFIPIFKTVGVWAVLSIIYYFIVSASGLKNKFIK
jgi:hypothetical protein